MLTKTIGIKEAVKAFLEDEIYSFQRQKDGTYIVEIDADYRDELSEKTIGEIVNSSDPMCEFYCKVEDSYQEYIWECEDELKKKTIDGLTQDDGPFPEGLTDEQEEEVNDWLYEFVSFEAPYKHYLNQDVCVNIMMDTGDGNYDFTLNAHYPCWYGGKQGDALDNKASIVWLAQQQGYTKGQLRKALDNGDMANPKGFLESMRVELANMASHMQTLTFLVEMSFEKLLMLNQLIKQQDRNGHFYDARKNPYCGYIVLDKGTMCGLYDPWQGGGSVLEVQLEKDVKIPVKYIWTALPDEAGPGYSVSNVYGMCRSAWRDTLKEIHSPEALKDCI